MRLPRARARQSRSSLDASLGVRRGMSRGPRSAASRATSTDRVQSMLAAPPGFREWSARLEQRADRLQRRITRLRRKYSAG